MKEFHAQDGGRYTYADDIINLQELALAFSSIFDGCDSFIISGCNVEGSNISAGYVYLNGRIRRFNGASVSWSERQYIYEENAIQNTSYASGTSKPGRHIYGCNIGSTVPESQPLTDKVAFIEVKQSGNTTIKDALFGRYAMLKESLAGQQTISDAITFNKVVKSNNSITATGQMSVLNGSASCKIMANTNMIEISSIVGGRQYALAFLDNDKGIKFNIDGVTICEITTNGFVANSIEASTLKVGNISVSGKDIFNGIGENNTATVDINMVGYDGARNYYRDFKIGDGKGAAVMTITGSNKATTLNGLLTLRTTENVGLVLWTPTPKDSDGLLKNIVWLDISNSNIASIGYSSNTNKVFKLNNSIGDIEVQGLKAVNIGPAIKENGTLLSEKYALQSQVEGLGEDMEDRFNEAAIKKNGLSQFINESYKTTHACQDIGAQPKLRDSGWLLCTCYACTSSYVVARQIGSVVYISGWIIGQANSSPYFVVDQSIGYPDMAASPTDSTIHYPVARVGIEGSFGTVLGYAVVSYESGDNRWVVFGGDNSQSRIDVNLMYIAR